MHEASIISSVFRIIREKMHELYGKEMPVKKVKLVIGHLTTVVPAALDLAVEIVSKGTVFENADIEVEYVPLKVKCRKCGAESILDEPFMFCRSCEGIDLEILSGRELYVDSFEIDEEPVQKKS